MLGGNKHRRDPSLNDPRYIRGMDKAPWGRLSRRDGGGPSCHSVRPKQESHRTVQKIRVTLWGQVKTPPLNCLKLKWQQPPSWWNSLEQVNPNTSLSSAQGPLLSDRFLEVRVQNVHRNPSHPSLRCFEPSFCFAG